jgi:hypothetical protein
MTPTQKEIIHPVPYFMIGFGCSHRAFYNVKKELCAIGKKVGIKPREGYMDELCDWKGSVEEITVYRGAQSEPFVDAILKHYEVADAIPEGMDIVLSIF